MARYICIHGHFYQPPRENPWLEAIELQESAYPFHDWNERIDYECYAPNAASRILDDKGRIVEIVNNYAKISFNFGPTLLAWLEEHDPDTYTAVLEADREAVRYFGHGAALMQPYSHLIMPLAEARDQETQFLWGLRDFRLRFERDPEGVWLPEAAVDLATLETAAAHGVRFTVLAPHQAARVRRLDGGDWRPVAGGAIDPKRPYLQRLPSGREIAIFFYDGPASRAVAFEGLLRNGERFAQRLLGLFHPERTSDEIVHIATDGETYGHHHRHGDMALAYALRLIERGGTAELTNYGAFIERYPPTQEVEIFEDTSWSCAHGVERWRSDCGCHTGGEPGWSQAWRAPLRAALDWLRERLRPEYERRAAALLRDPWAARDAYIDVILDRSHATQERFLSEQALRPLEEDEKVTVFKLLELQRHLLLMYTSCGWFFNDVAGIETVQVLQYAGRAIQLAQELFGPGIEEEFLTLLERARSNTPAGNGRQIYERSVRPAMVDLEQVGAHFALDSLFEPQERRKSVYCYTVQVEDYQVHEAGRARLALGQIRVTSEITRETSPLLSFAVLHFGDHNLNGGIAALEGAEGYEALVDEARRAFDHADLTTVIRIIDRYFPSSSYSVKSLFGAEQRRILDRILEDTLQEAEETYRRLYQRYAPITRFLTDLDLPLPNAFQMAAEFVLNTSLIRVFSDDDLDLARAEELLEEARTAGVDLDAGGLGYALRETLEWLAHWVSDHPGDLAVLRKFAAVVGLARSLPFEVPLWKTQNVFYDMLRTVHPEYRARAEAGDPEARAWVETFGDLGAALRVAVH